MKFIEHSNSVYKSNKKFISPKQKKITRFILELSIFVVILSILLGILSEVIQSNNTLSSLKKSHRLSGYGEYKIAYAVSGIGDNLVLFESDIGETLLEWNPIVRDAISGVKMLYYDRFGYGGSEKYKDKTSVDTQVDVLNNLIINTGYDGKQILVSEGYGSLIHMEYLDKYKDKVGGVIFINPTIFNHSGINNSEKIKNEVLGMYFKLIATLNIPKLLDKFSCLDNRFIDLYRESAISRNLDYYLSRMMSRDYYNTVYNEVKIRDKYLSNIDLSKFGTYGLPVIVIESESNRNSEYERMLKSHFSNLEIIYFETIDDFTYNHSDYLKNLIKNMNSRLVEYN